MGTPLGPKYIPYTYMDPLGTWPERVVEWRHHCGCAPRSLDGVGLRAWDFKP